MVSEMCPRGISKEEIKPQHYLTCIFEHRKKCPEMRQAKCNAVAGGETVIRTDIFGRVLTADGELLLRWRENVGMLGPKQATFE